MKFIVAGHEAVTASEFTELALGIDLELFTGPAGGESERERAARLDVAREVLAELHLSAPELAEFAESLLRTSPLSGRPVVRRSRRKPVRRPARLSSQSVGVAA
ncbi:hypothetical protein G3I40_08670 [Streptomyces sp. SID14478]|uniref:hypothetical protein n=1 Tax=Streptomyces sp. SID14478 TaxID=2706073 RepID=UPI0013DBE61A|nr:hypothetical protein [Streptomyces sp. SID14478]NEB75303.1 hypothetical protein [Streptomyces sp. SID14478]